MIIRSKAPLRISFAGGGTDVEPYISERGGVALSTSIARYAYASLRFPERGDISVTSLDYDTVSRYDAHQPVAAGDRPDLVQGVIRRLYPRDLKCGLDFFLHCDAPPGSGLGSSSTMMVALIGLFRQWLHLPLTNYEIADLAYQIERHDLALAGGKQDQYAATFGGFSFIEFYRDATIVNPLRIPPDVLDELHYNLLLCYTGKTRLSARIIDSQVAGYTDRRAPVVAALDELKGIATALKNALLQARLGDFGALLHEAWQYKKQLAEQISDPEIDQLYDVARKHGALGGKITGAGGGGYMFFYVEFDKKHKVAEQLERCGARVVDFAFDFNGLQTWVVR